jgi:transporter family protein
MFIIFLLFWYPKRAQYAKFQWRYIIPLIGICLTIADFIYFWALAKPGALVAIVSTVRRASVLVSFTLGAVIFKEKNIRTKGLILIGILAGIALIIMGG